MEKTIVRSDAAPRPVGAYSQAVRAGNLVFCSGQIPLDPATGELVGAGDVKAQAKRVMENLKAVLAAAGAEFTHVVKSTVYLMDLADFAAVNEIYSGYVDDAAPPARVTIQVAGIPRGALVEIEMTAVV